MRPLLLKTEILLALACVGLLAVAVFGPAIAQPGAYHHFADQRTLWGLPLAKDVLSNLPFALAGLAGFRSLYRAPAHEFTRIQRALASLFFAGLLLTAAGSSGYHWQPDDAGLAFDRGAMAVAFAGALGLAAAARVSDRAGVVLAGSMLGLAPIAVAVWASSGNVLPWAVLQFGGILLLVSLALVPARGGALNPRWGWVIGAYAAAKLLEMNDHEVFRLTGEAVSGHTLKHLVAALAAWPVIAALGSPRQSRHNAPGGATTRTKNPGTRHA